MNSNSSYRLLFVLGSLLVLASVINSFFKGYTYFPMGGALTPLFAAPFAFGHGVLRYGWKKMLAFFAVVFVVGWSYESMSIATGFPFGHYNYTEVLGKKLGNVPFSIMPAYFAFGYLSWTIGDILLSKRNNLITGIDLFLIPFVASFIMVIWDLTMDPINSTLTKTWIWHDGGVYFGVPFKNYLGWFLCVFTFFVIFAWMNKNTSQENTSNIVNNPYYWVLPPLMYSSVMTEYLFGMVGLGGKGNIKVKSLDGHEWWSADIYGSLTLVALFTIVPMVLFCAVRIRKDFGSYRQNTSLAQ